jgi:hypothetical protein
VQRDGVVVGAADDYITDPNLLVACGGDTGTFGEGVVQAAVEPPLTCEYMVELRGLEATNFSRNSV